MRRGGPRAGDECHSDGQRRSADARTAALHALHAAPCRSSATPSSRRGRVCLGESDEKVYACEVFSQIGRASRRESVCPYVKISVVAVTLKKNRTTTTIIKTKH